MTPILAPALALCCLLPATALAETFTPVTRQQDFVHLVSGKDLTRFGIRLSVSPTGDISGRAFGRKVTGAWEWNGQYFCRELYVGSDDLGGPNCQAGIPDRRGHPLDRRAWWAWNFEYFFREDERRVFCAGLVERGTR